MRILRPKSRRPIPSDAKMVFKGKLFDVYQWPQKMFDGSISTFEGLKRVDTVNIFPITHKEKVILGKQEQPGTNPFIGGFGGRIEKGESPLKAAKRELLEETGYRANRWRLWFTSQPEGKIDWAIYTFIALDLEKVSGGNLDPGEKIELIEFSFDDFIKETAKENFRDWEVSLHIYRSINDKHKLSELRKIFCPSPS